MQWFGSEAAEPDKAPAGTVANKLLYRHDEARLEIVKRGRPWRLDGDRRLSRLVSEARRMRLAQLFDAVQDVCRSDLEPLPNQISHGTPQTNRHPLPHFLSADLVSTSDIPAPEPPAGNRRWLYDVPLLPM